MTVTLARPDLDAHERSVRADLRDIVAELVQLIGKKLTAYVGGAKDVRAVERWIDGGEAYRDAEPRLRATYHVVKFLSAYDKPAVVQAWLMGLNPQLEDQSPLSLLRKGKEENNRAVLGAARAFAAGG